MAVPEVHRLATGSQTLNAATPDIPVKIGYFLRFPSEAADRVVYEDIHHRDGGSTAARTTND
ncbi:hypothetical protein KX928_03275 [Roseobacter sp. YSTF-M11]|uniref:Uncharacterized protein n=1 Tax=Roseobacter insulae TaxID=2859783 RepID=A0A9X1FSF0_9RHOB|nr:hypothetical protein [Roseobacter insulae]MBW4706803.1 hypothetical protein [Roseobacter insulae]